MSDLGALYMHAFLPPLGAESATSRRRVLIVDDHNFFAACLRTLLDGQSDLVVCDMMTNSRELRERIARLAPDLLVIDLSLGEEDGLEVAARLRAIGIATPVLFVSSMGSPTPEQLAAIPNAAFIAKSKTPAEFLKALRGILAEQEGRLLPMALGRSAAQA